MATDGDDQGQVRGESPGTGPVRVTSKDVAAAARVSRSSVSRAFTPGAPLSTEKRTHILAVAERLGYRPNLMARGLSGSRTGLVAVVVGAVASPYEAWFLQALSDEIRARGMWPLLVQVERGQQVEPALDHALAYQVDGAVIAAGSVSRRLAERCLARGAPIVMVGRVPEGGGADAVCCDNRAGMKLLVARLLATGRRRIAWIGGTLDTFSDNERHGGLVEALAAHGLSLTGERRGDYTVDGGLAQALALLTGPDRPEALVCGNDAMALGALAAARRLGMPVPQALAVAGFDDIPAASWEPYSLTTVANPVGATVREALHLLCLRIEGDASPPRVVRLPPQLKLRQTL